MSIEEFEYKLYSPNNDIHNIGCEAISNNGHKCDITFQLKTFGINKIDCKKYCINHIYNWFDNLFDVNLNFITEFNNSPKSYNSYNMSQNFSYNLNDIELNENIINLHCIIINYKSIENNKVNVPLLVFNDYTLIKHINNLKIIDKINKNDYNNFYNNLNKNYEITELKLIYLTNYENLFDDILFFEESREKYILKPKSKTKNISFYYNNNLINNIFITKNNLFKNINNKYLFIKNLLNN